jgi:hypothetical protein
MISRKNFLKLSALGAGAILLPYASEAQQKDKAPSLKPELVKEFVGVSHGNFPRVNELLIQEPGLLNASWDWGGGDFETGMEAAGHVGNKEIANYLLSHGARMNIFCAAMLGKIEIVKAVLTAFPGLKTSKGPHGLQLLHHAGKGGDDAKEVLDYLKSIGAN